MLAHPVDQFGVIDQAMGQLGQHLAAGSPGAGVVDQAITVGGIAAQIGAAIVAGPPKIYAGSGGGGPYVHEQLVPEPSADRGVGADLSRLVQEGGQHGQGDHHLTPLGGQPVKGRFQIGQVPNGAGLITAAQGVRGDEHPPAPLATGHWPPSHPRGGQDPGPMLGPTLACQEHQLVPPKRQAP